MVNSMLDKAISANPPAIAPSHSQGPKNAQIIGKILIPRPKQAIKKPTVHHDFLVSFGRGVSIFSLSFSRF
jgi:hypothetical protein